MAAISNVSFTQRKCSHCRKVAASEVNYQRRLFDRRVRDAEHIEDVRLQDADEHAMPAKREQNTMLPHVTIDADDN